MKIERLLKPSVFKMWPSTYKLPCFIFKPICLRLQTLQYDYHICLLSNNFSSWGLASSALYRGRKVSSVQNSMTLLKLICWLVRKKRKGTQISNAAEGGLRTSLDIICCLCPSWGTWWVLQKAWERRVWKWQEDIRFVEEGRRLVTGC